ncbi:ATP-dependent RNA helicase dbp6 [Microsporum ferrugineum]
MADIANHSRASHRTEDSSTVSRKRKRNEGSSDRSQSAQNNSKKKSSAASSSRKRPADGSSSSKADFEAQAQLDGLVQGTSPAEGEAAPGMEYKPDGRKTKKGSRDVAGGSDQPSRRDEVRRTTSKRESGDSSIKRKVTTRKKEKGSPAIPATNGVDGETTRHKKIMSKYEKSKRSATGHALPILKENKAEPIVDETHGLVPLPQPALAPTEPERPSYTTLPPWLAAPSTASAGHPSSFSDLGIGDSLVDALKDKGFTEALPVQSAVIPLLSKSSTRYPGDVCVSAATGSGKTLAYVLPLFSGLERLPVARLRAVIIVPTRELVKQVRDACELCSGGSGLRIGTAVGSSALKDEQTQIMEQNRAYKPDSWTSGGNGSNQMTAEEWASFSLTDYVAEVEEYSKTLPDHVIESSPCVDILICTPGRLVDHIRSTKGFTLESLEWLVIDEADRLLNESFQEWVDIVLPALDGVEKSTCSGPLYQLTKGINCPVKPRWPQKVVLSATMTRDITKLNSLRLQNPKLVAVDAAEKDNAGLTGQDSNFALPSLLDESSILVGDGSEKPLYLLKLVRSSIGMVVDQKARTKNRRMSISTSSSDSSDTTDSSDDASLSSSSSSSPGNDSSDSDSDSQSSVSSHSSTSNKQSTFQPSVLIFTKSSEAASRLSRLLTLIHPYLDGKIGTLIKSNKSSTSRRAISAYKRGKIRIIIATDRASRGLDLPLLDNVINYDVPNSLTTYVHRVGRTARAGRPGTAWTLVTHSEGRWFKNEISRGNVNRAPGKTIRRVALKLDDRDRSELQERYGKALKQLEAEVAGQGKTIDKPKAS